MSSTTATERRRQRARRGRVAHPLNERLIPGDITDAPAAIIEAQAQAEAAVKTRAKHAEQLVAARQAVRNAPSADDEATRQALAAGKAPPKPTTATVEAKRAEAARVYELAREVETEALDRLAEVVMSHAAEWQAKRAETLREKSSATVEQLGAALEALRGLEQEFVLVRWLHLLDAEAAATLSLTKAPGLREGDLDPEQALLMLSRIAEQAPERAVAGESGREKRAGLRAARRSKRSETFLQDPMHPSPGEKRKATA